MLLDLTISQLDTGPMPPERSLELAQLGYLQWLGALPIMADYRGEALHAYASAMPFTGRSPAVAAFCDLLLASTRSIRCPWSVWFGVGVAVPGQGARRSDP